jgi:uncharacterized membrane protein
MAFCTVCGAQTPDGSTVCPACSRSGPPVARPAQTAASGLTDNLAGALAYLLIPAIVFLAIEPYNRNRFIRFHSFQSVFFAVALIALSVALSILTFIPFIGLILIPVHLLIGLGSFVVWIILTLKAYQGQTFKLPVIGDIAEQQAGS